MLPDSAYNRRMSSPLSKKRSKYLLGDGYQRFSEYWTANLQAASIRLPKVAIIVSPIFRKLRLILQVHMLYISNLNWPLKAA